MSIATRARVTLAEVNAAYEKFVKPYVKPGDVNKFVEIDVDSGDYEIGIEEDAMHDRLLSRRPNGRFVIKGADGGAAGSFGSL